MTTGRLLEDRGVAVNNFRSEAIIGLIQVNDDEVWNGGQARRVYGCQL